MTVSVEPPRSLENAISGRRRPGRKDVSPELIELFRAPAADDDIPEDLRRALEDAGELPIKVDPIAPARGIALAIALSVPIWALLVGGGYALLK